MDNSFAKPFGLMLFVLAILPTPALSKFTHIYPGIATDGLNACLADHTYNFTRITISHRENAGHAFTCIMANIGNDRQSNLSSGASILGLIPTAITLLGNRRKDINLIHRACPLLAFFLSFGGISVDSRVVWRNEPDTKAVTTSQPTNIRQSKFPLNLVWNVNPTVDPMTKQCLLAVHILAFLVAITVFWQSYDISQRAVVCWSCWTSFLPLIWFLLGPLIHAGEITFLTVDRHLHPYLSPVLMLALDTLNKVQFLAGTAILCSLGLVSGHNAVKVLVVYGGAAIVMRECAVWVLETLSLNKT